MSGDAIDAEIVAVVVVRDGRLTGGADEAVAEAGGAVVLAGRAALGASQPGPVGARRIWCVETGTSPAAAARVLAPLLAGSRLVVLPASPDGRDLAPHLAALMGRRLLPGAVKAGVEDGRAVVELLRADGRVVVPVSTSEPAVATVWPGSRGPAPEQDAAEVAVIEVHPAAGEGPAAATPAAVEVTELIEPDPATMDLADAPRVVAGGAGMVPEGAGDEQAQAIFRLLADVAAALGASAGATRVVTDAGWMGYDRQIGTTGVSLNPELYVALGISGASQHIGGIGDPERIVSVNLDASCPMTGLADLGLVADAPALLVEMAGRLGVPVPSEVLEVVKR